MADAVSARGVRFTHEAVNHFWELWRVMKRHQPIVALVPSLGRFGCGGYPSPPQGGFEDNINGFDFTWCVDEPSKLEGLVLDATADGWLVPRSP